MHINGFTTNEPYEQSKFVPPCHHILVSRIPEGRSARKQPRLVFLIFICIPVSPGNSRMIILTGRNFALWIDQVVPRWIYHIGQNLIICSDMYLLHIEEKKLMETGFSNWLKVCFVPTKSDAKVVAFRKWLKKYSGGQVDWGNGLLPPTPPREQLMDRYWSHVVNCSSCNGAYKGLNALKVALQVFSVAAVAMVAAAKQGMISVAARNTLAVAAVLWFVASKWLSYFYLQMLPLSCL
ncbi:putative pheophorbide a oxygenase [Helianthus debilis subsp. tardiflorus]